MSTRATLAVVGLALFVGAAAWYWRGTGTASDKVPLPARETASEHSSRKKEPRERPAPTDAGHLSAAPAAAVAAAAEKKRLESFTASLRSDDYCAVREILEGAAGKGLPGDEAFSTGLRYRALEAAAGGAYDSDPCLQTAMARGREDLLRLTEGRESSACRFVRAAVLTGQWEIGVEPEEPSGEERREGVEILRSLAGADPGNGIFPLFVLGALEDGREQEMMGAYQDFLRAAHFTDPVQGPLEKNLQGFSRTGAAAWLVASSVASVSGSANYMRASGRAAAFAKQGLYPADYELFVRRLMEQLAETDRGPQRLPYLSLLNDSVLNGVAKSGRKFLSAEALAGARYLEQKNWMAYFRRRAFVDLNLFGGEHKTCEEMIAAARAAYPEYVQ